MKKYRCLELFCGTKSIGKIFEKNGWEVISVDIEPKWNPTHCCDIMNFEYKQYQPGYFDCIWASPPCTMFSILRPVGKNKQKYTPDKIQNDIINLGLPPLFKTLEIIKYFHAKIWFIENPQTGKMKDYLNLPYTDTAYCQYGMEYKKPTRIWNNIGLKLEKCKCIGRHNTSIGFPNGNKYYKDYTKFEKYVIPEQLCENIYQQIMEKIKN